MGASTNPPSPPCPPSPPPPPPAALIPIRTEPTATRLQPPAVSDEAPPGASLVELLTFNGYPFRDHWAYWVSCHSDPDIGVFMHASGNVARGFQFEIERGCRLGSGQTPTKRIKLQWVDGEHFVERTWDGENSRSDHVPVCGFERSAHKVPVPEKSLNTVEANVLQMATPGRKTQQRDCQTWIVESADQLFRDGIFDENVVAYLRELERCPSVYVALPLLALTST